VIVEIQEIDAQGDGVAVVGATAIPIPGALPGDRLEVSPDGQVLRAVSRVPRETIGCPHRECPGCPLQGLVYGAQLEAKRRRVARALERDLADPRSDLPDILPVRGSPLQVGYRAGAKLVLARDRRGVRVGIYRRGTHGVVDVPSCPVHRPLVARGVRALRRRLAAALGLVGHRGWLRYASFQASTEQDKLLLTLVTRTGEGTGILASLAARLREDVPELSGVVQNVNPTDGNEVFGPDWHRIWGEEVVWERLGDVVLRASPGAFLQANREAASWVYSQAPKWLEAGPGDRVADLYCGVGGLALNLAPRVGGVVGIEVNPVAIDDARASARRWGTGNAEFRCATAEAGWAALRAEGFRPDLITVNPPRKGLGSELAAALGAGGARSVLYVSCNPESLARDAAILCAHGAYRLARVQPVDFFPQTAHVEALALFERRA